MVYHDLIYRVLQNLCNNQSEIVMIKLYCCGPDYCSIYPLLYYFFQIRNGLGSSVFKLCCKDSAKPCTTEMIFTGVFTGVFIGVSEVFQAKIPSRKQIATYCVSCSCPAKQQSDHGWGMVMSINKPCCACVSSQWRI